jgi:hypothetical protein
MSRTLHCSFVSCFVFLWNLVSHGKGEHGFRASGAPGTAFGPQRIKGTDSWGQLRCGSFATCAVGRVCVWQVCVAFQNKTLVWVRTTNGSLMKAVNTHLLAQQYSVLQVHVLIWIAERPSFPQFFHWNPGTASNIETATSPSSQFSVQCRSVPSSDVP